MTSSSFIINRDKYINEMQQAGYLNVSQLVGLLGISKQTLVDAGLLSRNLFKTTSAIVYTDEVTFLGYGHGEFFMEFLSRVEKKGYKIIELPYTHPGDLEGNSKSFPNLYTFIRLGFFYILRLFRTIFKRQ